MLKCRSTPQIVPVFFFFFLNEKIFPEIVHTYNSQVQGKVKQQEKKTWSEKVALGTQIQLKHIPHRNHNFATFSHIFFLGHTNKQNHHRRKK